MLLKAIEDNNSNFSDVIVKSEHPNVKSTPHCIKHGAMNKVSTFNGGAYWRCCTTEHLICRTGCIEIKKD